jgi:integrase/recombinase XerD
MANWCSNSVAFEGNETALEQVKLEFIKMQIRENEENCGQLPEFVSDKNRGYFFDILLEDCGCIFNYQTRWSPKTENLDITGITYLDLQQFISQLHDIGIHPRSQARILSGIKSFYHFLLIDEYITSDPTELLEAPKIGLKLPEVLSINEINRLLDSIDLSKAEGQRNRAMLEVLYSCGLRVSELINLRFPDVYFNEGFIRVEGKGSKQRLVPISDTALKEIRLYLFDRNAVQIKKGYDDFLFLSRRGTGLSRIMVFHIIKEQAVLAGITKNISPHTFRHSFAPTYLREVPTFGQYN